MRGTRKGWLLVAVLMAGCETATDPPVPDLRVEDLVLEARGDTASLVAVSDGVLAVAEWESLDPSIVTVTASGLAAAVATGTARVQASVAGAVDTGIVRVLPPVHIRISELEVVTDPNGARGMGMRIRNEGGRGYYRLEFWKHGPDGRKRRVLHYTTDSEAAPGMDIIHKNYLGEDLAEWVVAYSREPVAEEPVRTSCARLDGEVEPCPSDLPDPAITADSVTVSPAGAVIQVGDTLLYAARAFARGVELTGRTVVWSTPSPDVISLSEIGQVVALKPGYGQVDATVDGITGSVALTVASEDPGQPRQTVASVQLNPARRRVWVGQGFGVAVTVYDSAMQELEGKAVSWATEDTAVARVDSTGFVTGAGHGRTRVVATADGVSGYAVVDSYARPEGAAELEFYALHSEASDPGTLEPAIDTTWVDSAGVVHDAWIRARPGSLSMQWDATGGHYSQELVLSTYIYEAGELRTVAQNEYTDEGTLERRWDYLHGREVFDFTSTTTEGLTYKATWSIPGELEVDQAVGSIAKRKYYFRLPI